MVLISGRYGEAYWYRRLYDYDCVRIILYYELYYRLHCRRVEEIFLAVVVGRRGYNDIIGVFICGFRIYRSDKVKFFLRKIFFDIFVLDRRLPLIYHIDFLRDDIDSDDFVVLR